MELEAQHVRIEIPLQRTSGYTRTYTHTRLQWRRRQKQCAQLLGEVINMRCRLHKVLNTVQYSVINYVPFSERCPAQNPLMHKGERLGLCSSDEIPY